MILQYSFHDHSLHHQNHIQIQYPMVAYKHVVVKHKPYLHSDSDQHQVD
jgi:hypothetical protein